MKGDSLLMCAFCPNACHFGCLGMDVRERAPNVDWQCPVCRKADDLTRLDERPRKQSRLGGLTLVGGWLTQAQVIRP